jgi:hypothetical protein
MANELFEADASPEKRLFISLITRDISLADAIIDLLDNSVNAAMRPIHNAFSSANDFHSVFARKSLRADVTINVSFDRDRVIVKDNAYGIDFETAQHEVFRFGHADGPESRDRLSVYGIGMKRALFKIGKHITMLSEHKDGGFGLTLNVPNWAKDATLPWTIPISKRPRRMANESTGTTITISDIHPEIRSRLMDKTFETELKDRISKVYSFFIGRIVNIYVNGQEVDRTEFEIGEDNFSHDKFKRGKVDCSILAGIATPAGGRFLNAGAGWFVFCNFRTVLYGDKSLQTGWGGGDLPLFQPKHRPFLGIVLFTSSDPEALPWTTTKGHINEDSAVWQEAKLKMAAVGKPVTGFLDKRYSDEGTSIQPSGIAKLAGEGMNVFDAAIGNRSTFILPSRKTKKPKTTTKIQYEISLKELERVRRHFGRTNMAGTEIGRYTFDYFMENEVGEK